MFWLYLYILIFSNSANLAAVLQQMMIMMNSQCLLGVTCIQGVFESWLLLVNNVYSRYVSNNKFKLVKSFQLDNAQQVTAFSAINSFHSCMYTCIIDLRDCSVIAHITNELS